MYTTSVDTV